MSKAALYKVWIGLTDAEEEAINAQFGYDPESGDDKPEELEEALDTAVSEKVDEVMDQVKANIHTIDYELADMVYV